jgi:hypothetical protein
MKSVGSHGSVSLLFMMVSCFCCAFMSGLLWFCQNWCNGYLPSVIVEFSLQSHGYVVCWGFGGNEWTGLENGRQWSFEEHRRVHYDEYRKAKWLEGHSDAEDEDDGEGREVNRFDEGASSSGSTCSSGSCSSGSRNSCKGLDCDSSIVKEMGKVDLQENPLVASLSN